jgi:hypothetical protein
MNHSLFVEIEDRVIDTKLMYMLMTRGKIVSIDIQKDGEDRTTIYYEIKGRGWRATIKVDVKRDAENEHVSPAELEETTLVRLEPDNVVMDVKATCFEKYGYCVITYSYLETQRTIWLVAVIDLDSIENTDKELLIALNILLNSRDMRTLIRPM